MTTTNVFAELLIIGIETLTWIALLIFCLFGYGWIDFAVFNNLAIAIPLAAAAYVLRLARQLDHLLSAPANSFRTASRSPGKRYRRKLCKCVYNRIILYC